MNLMFVYYKGTVYQFVISALICGVKYEKHLKHIYHFIVESCVFCTTYKTGTKANIHDIKIQSQ